jgi:maleate isomerase
LYLSLWIDEVTLSDYDVQIHHDITMTSTHPSPKNYRIGLIVPSSNTTMETEIPLMLKARESVLPEQFSFHSSRMRMKSVTKAELEAMDRDSDRCAIELSDGCMDAMGYACLVAIMSMGKGYHRQSQQRLHEATVANGSPTPVITSAGALVDGLHAMNAKRVSIITPYMKPLTQLVIDYIEHEGIEVVDSISLEISDNLVVGARDPKAPADLWKQLNLKGVDTIVASACVQMPSLAAVPLIEAASGLPVVSSSICTTYALLKSLGLERRLPGAGTLLSGRF